MRNLIGYFLISLPFIVLFVIAAISGGILSALSIYGIAFLILFIVVLGVYLIQ